MMKITTWLLVRRERDKERERERDMLVEGEANTTFLAQGLADVNGCWDDFFIVGRQGLEGREEEFVSLLN